MSLRNDRQVGLKSFQSTIDSPTPKCELVDDATDIRVWVSRINSELDALFGQRSNLVGRLCLVCHRSLHIVPILFEPESGLAPQLLASAPGVAEHRAHKCKSHRGTSSIAFFIGSLFRRPVKKAP